MKKSLTRILITMMFITLSHGAMASKEIELTPEEVQKAQKQVERLHELKKDLEAAGSSYSETFEVLGAELNKALASRDKERKDKVFNQIVDTYISAAYELSGPLANINAQLETMQGTINSWMAKESVNTEVAIEMQKTMAIVNQSVKSTVGGVFDTVDVRNNPEMAKSLGELRAALEQSKKEQQLISRRGKFFSSDSLEEMQEALISQRDRLSNAVFEMKEQIRYFRDILAGRESSELMFSFSNVIGDLLFFNKGFFDNPLSTSIDSYAKDRTGIDAKMTSGNAKPIHSKNDFFDGLE